MHCEEVGTRAGKSRPSRSAKILARQRELHWLPVRARVVYKVAMLMHVALNTGQPAYLRDCLSTYIPHRSLRSSNTNWLTNPPVKLSTCDRGFESAAPTVWNSLPSIVTSAPSLSSFKTNLKTFLFKAVQTDVHLTNFSKAHKRRRLR